MHTADVPARNVWGALTGRFRGSLTGKTKDALNVPHHPRLRSQLLRERHLFYVHGMHRIEAPQNSRCNTAAGTLCTRVNRTRVHGASPGTLDDGTLGRGIGGGEGERLGGSAGDRVRQRERWGFHIMRVARVLRVSQRRVRDTFFVWRLADHRNKT